LRQRQKIKADKGTKKNTNMQEGGEYFCKKEEKSGKINGKGD
jgi:hypothetical protein